MANSIQWKETEVGNIFNTAIAASAKEQIVKNTQRVDYFNRLLVTNLDAVDIRIDLDNDTSRSFIVQNTGGVLQIEPEDGVHFHQVVQVNLDTVTAQVADRILFRWARADQA